MKLFGNRKKNKSNKAQYEAGKHARAQGQTPRSEMDPSQRRAAHPGKTTAAARTERKKTTARSSNPSRRNPARRRKKRSVAMNTFLYVVMVLVVSLVLATTVIFLSNDLLALAKEDKEITITVPEDASMKDVAKLLDKNGVIQYGTFFRLFTGIVYKDVEFRPGMWTLNSSMDYRQIVNELRVNSKSTVTVTIPEGYSVEQVVDTLLEAGLSNRDDLESFLQDGELNYDFLPEDLGNDLNRLEGYLFPDTYEFYVSDEADTIINKMLGNFSNKIKDNSSGVSLEKQCENQGLTVEEMVIIASMVQKEAVNDGDMPEVSGVIMNRLAHKAEYPYLNIDATIQYAVGHLDLTDEDMQSDSPYNTYTSKGLPPGPICNPGMEALTAVVQPAVHDYYFYVASADGTEHIYAKTQEEQTANIQAVQAEKDAAKAAAVEDSDEDEEE